ncbi:hypothetical protein BDB01DRAFT_833328 [Pilobolus umbonatus]|nr:hypothetical protein BDB01DRAFT_833328 [Pilobolus umbonatus]
MHSIYSISLFLITAVLTYALPANLEITRSYVTRDQFILPFKNPTYYPKCLFHGTNPPNPVPTGPLHRIDNYLKSKHFPRPWSNPDTSHPGVQEAIKSINWDYVPCFSPRNQNEVYDHTYDDGPLVPLSEDDLWAEPRFYDFLARLNQKATLFCEFYSTVYDYRLTDYSLILDVGSNVVAYPEAVLRGLKSGHTLCAHSWSHPAMTSLTNEDIVAQLYWSIRAIKEAAGVTTRCWRPPFGDIDDRVRAIAHQMGLSTILWDTDSYDWRLPSIANDYAGTETMDIVDARFQSWIDRRKSGKYIKNGHIVLEHETSNVTVVVAEKWLPLLQKNFDVKTVHECAPQLPSPYWEH